MPKSKHGKKRHRSRSRSSSRDDNRWMRRRLAELQQRLDDLSAEKAVEDDSVDRSLHSDTQNNSPIEREEIRALEDDEYGSIFNDGPEVVDGQGEPDELDNDLIEILGTEPANSSVQGPPVHKAIMSRWTDILKNGLNGEVRPEILKKYLVPENIPMLKVPKLNPEVAAAVSPQILRRDERLAQKQSQLGATISAVGEAITSLLAREGVGERHCIQLLSDAGRLLCDFHHGETSTRRELILINLNKSLKDTLADAPVDHFLFGETLEDRLRTAKNLEKSSQDLKLPKPRMFKKTVQTLNTRSPSRPLRGARNGQQYQYAPSQRRGVWRKSSHRDISGNQTRKIQTTVSRPLSERRHR